MVRKHFLEIGAGKLLAILLILCLSGCDMGRAGQGTNEAEREPVVLRMAVWNADAGVIDYLTEKVKQFRYVMPHVTVEIEPFSSDSDYLQAMLVRSAASELPDLYELKPNWLQLFEQELLPLNGYDSVKRSLVADRFAIQGKVLAVPASLSPEWVYYHPSVFERLGLEPPETWEQFIAVLKAIKADGKEIPLALGAKDVWPTYPFNEFLPHIVSGSESYLSEMARQNQPFGKGTPFYAGFTMAAQLYEADLAGLDPLGTGWEQAVELFAEGEAAVLAAGQWFLPLYEEKTGGLHDLNAFPLPYRDNGEEPLRLMTFADHFLGVSRETVHPEEAKAFLEWYFSPEVYGEYVRKTQSDSAFKDVAFENKFVSKLKEKHPTAEFIYLPGDGEYARLSNAIQLDVKSLGQDMLAGRSVDEISSLLNRQWAKAKGE